MKLRQKSGQVTAEKRTSYGKKPDKLRQKTGQVTEKKSGSYGKKVRFNIEVTEKK